MSHKTFETDIILSKVEQDLNRPIQQITLSPNLESQWRSDFENKQVQGFFLWHSFLAFANVLLLFVDSIAGVLQQGLVARLVFVVPAYLLSLLFLKRGPRAIRLLAKTLPFLVLIAALTILISFASDVEAGRYQMALSFACVFVSTLIPYTFYENTLLMAGGFAINLGGLHFLLDDVSQLAGPLFFQFLTVLACIIIGFERVRQNRNRFLMILRDDIKTQQLTDLTNTLIDLSETDELTGLKNRRRLYSAIPEIRKRANNVEGWLNVIMIDVDNFKSFNDTAGHLAGDQCLKKIAFALARRTDESRQFVARYGGEEFVVVAVTDSIEEGEAFAETLRRSVEELALPHPASPTGSQVTISAGIVQIKANNPVENRELFGVADMALYDAKENGRNRICKRDVGATESNDQ